MTKITIFKKNGKILEYQIKGHSCYAEQGKDIVCCAISTAGQMALVGLKDVLSLKIKYDLQDAYLHVELLEDFENISAQAILSSMEKTLENIAENYAKFVKMEVKDYVY